LKIPSGGGRGGRGLADGSLKRGLQLGTELGVEERLVIDLQRDGRVEWTRSQIVMSRLVSRPVAE
jgi:hypothetical protein